jgi:hypothetical protein
MEALAALSLAVTIALQICILTLLLRRELHKRFAWFFIYIIYALSECILRLAVSHDPNAYFRVYWSTEVGDVALTIVALRESFLSIFRPETRLRWFRWIFWNCIVIAAAYASWEAWALPPRQAGRLMTMMLDLEFAIGAIVAMFGLLYAAAIKLFGILEHQRESGIIFGFTANATMATLGVIARSAFGAKFRMLTDFIPAIAYILAEAIWTRDLLRPERTLPQPGQTFEQMSEAIGRYTAILHRYLGKEQ